jgi:hypothetical protein
MKFIYADSLDYVDPNYDFVTDQSPEGRRAYWDDQFTHEYLGYAPYDGMLVSRAIVGDHRFPGKYTETQAMRFRRVGAAEFLRFPGKLLFGDSGAFSYHKLDEPPYSAEDMVAFYEDGGFTHGCSVDHVIFDFDPRYDAGRQVGEEPQRRYDITLRNAQAFLDEARRLGDRFTPMGVVQGWSPKSMAEAARHLEAMGYRYLAIGGMVPLKTDAIKQCLAAIRDVIRPETGIHVLGFAKADDIHEFTGFGITSFDTTSPLLRAFKDTKSNYYLPSGNRRLTYYTAIRIPQALGNTHLGRLVKAGKWDQELLQALEKRALDLIRAYDKDSADIDDTLEAILAYSKPLFWDDKKSDDANRRKIAEFGLMYRRTLTDRPWRLCDCPVCRRLAVEVIVFRASNRNKRRGMHNIDVFARHLAATISRNETANAPGQPDLFGR